MKKNFLIFMLTGALLGACSSNDVETSYEQELRQNKEVPVMFGTYIGNAAETRANQTGVLDITALRKANEGFGVFAIYTNDKNLATDTGKKPNFMYNEHVTWDSGNSVWTYSPIKYWPNEFGANAVSTNTDYLSFFAYAPWCGDNESQNVWDKTSTADATGIVALTTKTESSKYPSVTYRIANDPAKSVDLLYAKVEDATKPLVAFDDAASKVQFTFNHALARFGLKVQGVFDTTDPANPGTKKSETNIKLEGVEVTIKDASKEGEFDLKNQTWGSLSTAEDYVITVGSDAIAADLKSEETTKGVTATATDVLASGKYFMLIPQSKKLSVKVTYTVTTTDAAVDGGKASVQNVITKETASNITFEKGKAYSLNLLLGMRTVQMNITAVNNWVEDPGNPVTDLTPVWVPVNVTPTP